MDLTYSILNRILLQSSIGWASGAITKKHTVPLLLLLDADVLGLVVMATVVVTGAVVREGMIVVGSKVVRTSGEWKETKYKIKSYHANKRETQMIQIINTHTLFRLNFIS